MGLTLSHDGGTATIRVEGNLTVQTSPELEEAIRGLDEQVRDLDIDLSEVDFVSSAGLRVLVIAQKQTKLRGGRMRLLGPNDDVFSVLDMTGLSEVFVIER
ncbi:MAG: STAS domain-containing protein [Olsenella sp.]|nr:STAS domain-containing protein [Olsenella sp.]